jgi:hypothetical protein
MVAQNHRKLVLDGILSFFGEKDKEDTDDDATLVLTCLLFTVSSLLL